MAYGGWGRSVGWITFRSTLEALGLLLGPQGAATSLLAGEGPRGRQHLGGGASILICVPHLPSLSSPPPSGPASHGLRGIRKRPLFSASLQSQL